MPKRGEKGQPHDSTEPVYMIGVAARLVECHPQTLRMYERLGLVEPQRTGTNMRLYSADDIEKLRQIQRLTQDLGVNLAGVQVILDLLERIADMRREMVDEIGRVQRDAESELTVLRTRLLEAGFIVQVREDGGEPGA
jgi:MerR family transcriptional regulator, heat shock protein HspR